MTRGTQICSETRAFTLVELVTTMFIVSILGVVISGATLNASDSYLEINTTAQLHNELSVAMDRVVRELRMIELDETVSAVAPDVDSLTTTSINWGGSVSLSLVGDELLLNANGSGAQTLLSDVSAFGLRAYDEDHAAMATTLAGAQCDDIRRISVTISVTRNGRSESLRTLIFLRCALQGAQI